MTRIARLILAGVLLGAAAGCTDGSRSTSADGPEPLTLRQAQLVADTLHRNHEAGGATFSLTAIDPRGGGTVSLQGSVDWTTGTGSATVAGLRDADGEVTAVAWTRESVAEQRPSRSVELATRGLDPTTTFWLRSVDVPGRTVDRLIQIVLGLATERPDNAQLVLQRPDAGLLRTDTLRGVDVKVLSYSDRTRLWIDPATGDLLRFESDASGGGAPVLVDVLERGPVTVVLPPVVEG